jgi:short subunit dehydrogenase-like uncharacterized protein
MVRRRATSALVSVVAVVAVLLLAVALVPGLDSLNPFKTETEDRSQPVILKSLERLTEYRAASANLQVPVDVREDVGILPDFIAGKKTLIIASGTVDASVDFRGLKRGRNLVVSEDRKSVTITLPSARLSDARVDLAKTRVFDTDRGLVNRVGEAFGDGGADEERELLELAQRKLAEAAKAEPQLLRNAEDNTRAMLEGLMRGLGFERVTIRFAPPAT